jgi:hypothetical protein
MYAFIDQPADGFEESLRFWSAVTGTTAGPARGEQGEFRTLLPRDADPWLKVQRVGGRAGVHLDLHVDEPLADAAAEATGLGAAVVRELDDVVVCSSPGGLAFCLCPMEGAPRGPERVGASVLDQVCLDIPNSRYAAEVAFWARLTGWPERRGSRSEFVNLERAPGLPLQLLLQRLGDEEGEVTAHLDFACANRDALALEHIHRGAALLDRREGWTVMEAPGGRRYCLTTRAPHPADH